MQWVEKQGRFLIGHKKSPSKIIEALVSVLKEPWPTDKQIVGKDEASTWPIVAAGGERPSHYPGYTCWQLSETGIKFIVKVLRRLWHGCHLWLSISSDTFFLVSFCISIQGWICERCLRNMCQCHWLAYWILSNINIDINEELSH